MALRFSIIQSKSLKCNVSLLFDGVSYPIYVCWITKSGDFAFRKCSSFALDTDHSIIDKCRSLLYFLSYE